MTLLAQEQLSQAQGDVAMDKLAVDNLLQDLKGWNLTHSSEIPRVEKTYLFGDFAEALAFANQVGELAEKGNHHPALLVEWGKVTVSWWSHSLGGLHRNDLIMAARTDTLAG
ncbi:MAG TPA: 4a-hydroxytetrahydrobiopterin dehydratase [Pseudomonas xinjiangensis]|uniref:4a-hydroxytetrahydrobiopterin dehydratase n=2 Tax=root TaxID=1 RepID=A0A0F9XUB6_9ZZZZ|nr:4a-hydroxytetrahydrobiopterin dehydratase [Halopseudomonas xinjiangensis]HEC46674.1 4a-hydroxytetrahydrobiopterin dehydratase [Halopseudomonas xinjiangensis]